MADAYVIETPNDAAGIAIRERGGFRFYASNAPFWLIDQYKFRNLSAVHAAVQRLGRAASPSETRPDERAGAGAAKFVDCLFA